MWQLRVGVQAVCTKRVHRAAGGIKQKVEGQGHLQGSGRPWLSADKVGRQSWDFKPGPEQAPDLRVRKDHSQSPPKKSRLQHPSPVSMPPEWGAHPPSSPSHWGWLSPSLFQWVCSQGPAAPDGSASRGKCHGLFLTHTQKKQGWSGDRVLGHFLRCLLGLCLSCPGTWKKPNIPAGTPEAPKNLLSPAPGLWTPPSCFPRQRKTPSLRCSLHEPQRLSAQEPPPQGHPDQAPTKGHPQTSWAIPNRSPKIRLARRAGADARIQPREYSTLSLDLYAHVQIYASLCNFFICALPVTSLS